MRYGSLCSGIEAATVAWEPLGWKSVFYSEIEPFCNALLRHYYPQVPNLGDMTKWKDWNIGNGAIDVLVGGTPCQSFSVAGLRRGLADPRGNLMLTYLAIADALRPSWLVWENVPGVLSSNNGRDFGTFLGALGELGYGFAYRVLDAQYFGVAQRRRRVFVVGHLGDWRAAAAVLFERESLSGHPAPRRKAGQDAAPGIEIGPAGGRYTELSPTIDTRCQDGARRNQLAPMVLEVARCLTSRNERIDAETETFVPVARALRARANASHRADSDTYVAVAHTLTGNGFDASEDGTSRGMPIVPVAFAENQRGELRTSDVVTNLNTDGGKPGQGYTAALTGSAVRRLTPVECERLQGFPDNYTRIPYGSARAKIEADYVRYVIEGIRRDYGDDAPIDIEEIRRGAADGPRYRALGNSMAVPVMRWIGQRIDRVAAVISAQEVTP